MLGKTWDHHMISVVASLSVCTYQGVVAWYATSSPQQGRQLSVGYDS
jgi:hypothetical protein